MYRRRPEPQRHGGTFAGVGEEGQVRVIRQGGAQDADRPAAENAVMESHEVATPASARRMVTAVLRATETRALPTREEQESRGFHPLRRHPP